MRTSIQLIDGTAQVRRWIKFTDSVLPSLVGSNPADVRVWKENGEPLDASVVRKLDVFDRDNQLWYEDVIHVEKEGETFVIHFAGGKDYVPATFPIGVVEVLSIRLTKENYTGLAMVDETTNKFKANIVQTIRMNDGNTYGEYNADNATITRTAHIVNTTGSSLPSCTLLMSGATEYSRSESYGFAAETMARDPSESTGQYSVRTTLGDVETGYTTRNLSQAAGIVILKPRIKISKEHYSHHGVAEMGIYAHRTEFIPGELHVTEQDGTVVSKARLQAYYPPKTDIPAGSYTWITYRLVRDEKRDHNNNIIDLKFDIYVCNNAPTIREVMLSSDSGAFTMLSGTEKSNSMHWWKMKLKPGEERHLEFKF